jgi:uncharacterized protein (TIGR03085 family)
VGNARDERLALCALLDRCGPQAATLCAGWRTAELAAHLVLRERRPAAALGILGGPLARHTRRVQARLVATVPFADLVQAVRTGPPRLSVYAIPGADERLNLAEYFVHHEDVRRARPGWQPRELSSSLTDALWRQLARAGYLLRSAPVGIEFARPAQGGQPRPAGGAAPDRAVRMTVRARAPMVTVIGPPGELTLWAFGRESVARVRLDGSDADIRAVEQARRRV